MRQGLVYLWTRNPDNPLGGTVAARRVALERLDQREGVAPRLSGRFVSVRNGGEVNVPDKSGNGASAVRLGDAQPDANGDFLFEPGHGGGRMDKVVLAEPDFRWRYIQAARFGEVNTYYHLDRIAAHLDDLLHALRAPALPRVTAVVNAHHGATESCGVRDGVRREGRWVAFQGGHYRLPARRYDVREFEPLGPDGEIHLGPGRQLLTHGALVEAVPGRYRANASHNAGILYHEYGHHIVRHTADPRANRLRRTDRQDNRKTSLDEGTSDYWAASLLGTPHIWAWHRRHDAQEVHPRSLVSRKTMADFDSGPDADPHENGTIWGAALWDLRTRLTKRSPEGARRSDLLVLKSLLLLGTLTAPAGIPCRKVTRRLRNSFDTALACLRQADELLFDGEHGRDIVEVFAARGIHGSPAGAFDSLRAALCSHGP